MGVDLRTDWRRDQIPVGAKSRAPLRRRCLLLDLPDAHERAGILSPRDGAAALALEHQVPAAGCLDVRRAADLLSLSGACDLHRRHTQRPTLSRASHTRRFLMVRAFAIS